jgi:hypothetical protein
VPLSQSVSRGCVVLRVPLSSAKRPRAEWLPPGNAARGIIARFAAGQIRWVLSGASKPPGTIPSALPSALARTGFHFSGDHLHTRAARPVLAVVVPAPPLRSPRLPQRGGAAVTPPQIDLMRR